MRRLSGVSRDADTVDCRGPRIQHTLGSSEGVDSRILRCCAAVSRHHHAAIRLSTKSLLSVFDSHRNPVPYEGSMDEKYEFMVQKHARWFSDGQIDNQKNIQLSLSSHLPLTNEMTFVLLFST